MSTKEAVRDLLEQLPDDLSFEQIASEIARLNRLQPPSTGADVIVTEEGFVMLPVQISSAEAARAIRADRDAQ